MTTAASIVSLTLPGIDLSRELNVIIELEHFCRRDDQALLWLVVVNLIVMSAIISCTLKLKHLPGVLLGPVGIDQDAAWVGPEDRIVAATSSQSG